jgi:5-methylcytosine-specific restriction endonuclease McrA
LPRKLKMTPEAIKQRERWAANPRAYQKNREYRLNHTLRNLVHRHNSRAKRLGIKGKITEEQFRALCEARRWRCAYCFGRVVEEQNKPNTVGFDHIIPLSRGGKHRIDNVLPVCYYCNHEKGDRTPKEWFNARKAEGLPERPRWTEVPL